MHIPAGVYIMYVLASMYVVQHDVSVCVYSRTRVVCICILHMYERTLVVHIFILYESYYLFYELNKIYAYH